MRPANCSPDISPVCRPFLSAFASSGLAALAFGQYLRDIFRLKRHNLVGLRPKGECVFPVSSELHLQTVYIRSAYGAHFRRSGSAGAGSSCSSVGTISEGMASTAYGSRPIPNLGGATGGLHQWVSQPVRKEGAPLQAPPRARGPDRMYGLLCYGDRLFRCGPCFIRRRAIGIIRLPQDGVIFCTVKIVV